MNDVFGLDLPAAPIGRLCRRTEGWAAGLTLAALSIRSHENPLAFVDAQFAGLTGHRRLQTARCL